MVIFLSSNCVTATSVTGELTDLKQFLPSLPTDTPVVFMFGSHAHGIIIRTRYIYWLSLSLPTDTPVVFMFGSHAHGITIRTRYIYWLSLSSHEYPRCVHVWIARSWYNYTNTICFIGCPSLFPRIPPLCSCLDHTLMV